MINTEFINIPMSAKENLSQIFKITGLECSSGEEHLFSEAGQLIDWWDKQILNIYLGHLNQ